MSESSASPPPESLSLPKEIPPLSSHRATTHPEKVTALRLIADSVAQQRQAASRALITHPLNVSLVILLLAVMAQYMSLPVFFTTAGGAVMAALVAVRGATGGYLVAAEKLGWKWLEAEAEEEQGGNGKTRGKRDETVILITMFGEEVIATVVAKVLKKEKRALVRAWTTRLKYRGKGVGKDLLEQVVRIAIEEMGCKDVLFDEKHANSTRVLPSFYNGSFDKREKRARATLAELVAAQKGAKK